MAGLTFALPKGRILKQATPLLREAGVDVASAVENAGRKLTLELPGGHRVFLVKPTDVPTYVEYGVADVGIAGRDTLEEQGRDLYEPVDLGLAPCRLAVAEQADNPTPLRRGASVRVASKYPNLSRRHYASKGIAAEIIPLYGSVELGALTSLADQIVDLVESGETLRQNGLVEVETVMHVTSRLVVHPASLKLKGAVTSLIEDLRRAVGERKASVA
ncbi:MAG: ATP phosphoribosyltransferase [Myxococcota bacterium]